MDGRGAGGSSWRRAYDIASAATFYLMGGFGAIMLAHAAHARPWMLVVLLWLWGSVAGFLARGLVARLQ